MDIPIDVDAAVPADRLGAWVAEHVPTANGPVRVEQLSGGSSNLTFRVRDDTNDWVLRRPPLSHVLATAHDMAREHTVQLGLQGSDVPVAGMVALCHDETVIGAPFYLMQMLDGVVYSDANQVAHLTEAQGLTASYELVDVLARLHAVDFAAAGLGDFGRPEGYLARQVSRWCKQWDKSKLEEVPAVDEVAKRLEHSLPAESRHSIVHGDYSFNNTMFQRDVPDRMQAILDWEMSTLGDPLTDIGTLVTYWGPVGERMWQSRGIPQAHRANAGFPDVDVLLERYAVSSGTDLASIDFYRTLAVFKLAVISQGAAARRAAIDPESAATAVASVKRLADDALELSTKL